MASQPDPYAAQAGHGACPRSRGGHVKFHVREREQASESEGDCARQQPEKPPVELIELQHPAMVQVLHATCRVRRSCRRAWLRRFVNRGFLCREPEQREVLPAGRHEDQDLARGRQDGEARPHSQQNVTWCDITVPRRQVDVACQADKAQDEGQAHEHVALLRSQRQAVALVLDAAPVLLQGARLHDLLMVRLRPAPTRGRQVSWMPARCAPTHGERTFSRKRRSCSSRNSCRSSPISCRSISISALRSFCCSDARSTAPAASIGAGLLCSGHPLLASMVGTIWRENATLFV